MVSITNRSAAPHQREVDLGEVDQHEGDSIAVVGATADLSSIREQIAGLPAERGPAHLVVPDGLTIRVPNARVPDDLLLSLPRFTAVSVADGEVVSEAASYRNLYLRNGESGLLVKGSLYNLAVGLGLLPSGSPFGPEATALVLRAVEALLGLGRGALARGRLTRLEVRADLRLPRPVAHYVDACEDDSRLTPWRVGHDTVYHKAAKFEIRFYDKIEETLRRGARLPESYLGAHMARVECVLHRGGVPQFLSAHRDSEGAVRAALLADPAFRDDLVELWAGQARRLRFRRVVHPDFVPENATDRARWHAAQHLLSTGGPEAEVARIDADRRGGLLTPQQAKDQKEAVRALCRTPRYTSVPDLGLEYAAAVAAITTTDN